MIQIYFESGKIPVRYPLYICMFNLARIISFESLDSSDALNHSIAILMIDIDHFKSVNDNYGHLAGDQCLKVVAEQIQASNRAPTDLAARYGGEEFCFVLPETDSEGATVVAQRVLQQIENTVIPLESGNLRVTCSVGLYAGIPNSPKDVNLFVNRADAALYQSKQNGRNCLTSFSEAGSD